MAAKVASWQILSKNPDASSKFYAETFGWSVSTSNPLGYRELRSGSSGGVDGGVWPCPPEGHPMVQLFIHTDDLERTMDRAVGGGAKVIIPVQVLPQGERMAVLLDPEGIPFGLMS